MRDSIWTSNKIKKHALFHIRSPMKSKICPSYGSTYHCKMAIDGLRFWIWTQAGWWLPYFPNIKFANILLSMIAMEVLMESMMYAVSSWLIFEVDWKGYFHKPINCTILVFSLSIFILNFGFEINFCLVISFFPIFMLIILDVMTTNSLF